MDILNLCLLGTKTDKRTKLHTAILFPMIYFFFLQIQGEKTNYQLRKELIRGLN